MSSIYFYGAAGEVTGSSFLLTGETTRLLIDLGMYQGTADVEVHNRDPLLFSPSKLTSVALTHAHLDHCGRLPLLTKNGYRGKFYMTDATAALVELTLMDSAKIAAEDNEDDPLYTLEDVERVLYQIRTVAYDAPFEVGEFTLTMRDAGHILGSASIEVAMDTPDGRKVVVFSGDLGNSPEDIVKPTEVIKQADAVVMESTYGDRLHPKENASDIIMREMNEIERTGGVLLIPAFSVDRTQEILHKINHLKQEGKVQEDTPVFLDSPMAIRATRIYEQYRNLYGKEMSAHATHGDPFDFPGLFVTERAAESRKISEHKGAKVIIAGNGMMMGGRILGHAKQFLPLDTTRLLIVGYQGEETLGREILEGAKLVTIKGAQVPVNATIANASSMSAHADQNQLMAWLSNIRGLKAVFLVHGEDPSRHAIAEKISRELGIGRIEIPHLNERKPLFPGEEISE